MSDETLWDFPSDEPVERHGEFTLTVVRPPFPGPDGALPAHDEARARAFAEAFGTVDRVLDHRETIAVTELIEVDTRADLEVIRVGCWAGVTEINDPALISLSERFLPAQQGNPAAPQHHPHGGRDQRAPLERDRAHPEAEQLHALRPAVQPRPAQERHARSAHRPGTPVR
ncbi:DUF6333 family protein [Streptomyces rapamycinicus]|uniref:Uncharacterized protein n=1 Tax=Streptomyces rapamycinicus TaxID=1226757 RepID=A0ABR6LJX6_9ACTN|nr:DUF6333 family protein [Streptomyces rapamycinicus]MBB4782648.1 hypothetical protein [Streptomyces rapamycinicus]UTO63137.1 DUF6333 family protein [Streptomyces rapamycinicus]UTP31095.1 DUF6333 family protein [Streptomyces rapamycinicus NRRL 5491]